MSDRVRFALVGAGAISQSYASAFEKCEPAHLVAVADTRPEAARALAHLFSCPSHESYQSLAEAEKFDAVILCTPPATHPEISTYFLGRSTHVIEACYASLRQQNWVPVNGPARRVREAA